MLLEKGANDKDSIDRHLLEGGAHVALRLQGQLRERDSQAASQIVILSIDERASQRQVGTLVLDLRSCSKSRSFIIDNDSLRAIATIR